MATLNITNLTRQHHQFCYRLPESTQLYEQKIPAGAQVPVVRNVGLDIIEYIIEQHRIFGLVSEEEAKNSRVFVPQFYTIDQPASADRILETFDSNDVALNEGAAQRREDQAAVIADGIESTMRERGVEIARTEVSIVEETKGGEKPQVSEGFEIVAPGVQPRNGGKPGRRAAARE